MLFNSLSYAIFLPIVFLIYWVIPGKCRWLLLLTASYYFYMSWNIKYVVLILGTTIASYISGLLISRCERQIYKNIILIVMMVVSFGILFLFKYYNFAMVSISKALSMISISIHPVTSNLLLPVGISFYTFQTFSYVADVYKGDIKPEKHFGYYATFISFFPQLVAGPIERASNLLPQIKTKKHFSYELGREGLVLMLMGYFKKLVIADTLSKYVDRVYSHVEEFSGFALVLAIFFFSIQIYCDFSGYSDIAIGSAKLFGINLMDNFKSPYFSSSIKEFWSRWHISLSSWLRDYIYIPLGGNRISKIRTKINLIITFLVSGLWHGASWNYVIWGGVHGVAQAFCVKKQEDIEKKRGFTKLLYIGITFLFSNLTWVIFRAQTISDAIFVYGHMFSSLENGLVEYVRDGFRSIDCSNFAAIKILLAILFLAGIDYVSYTKDIVGVINKLPKILRWVFYYVVFFMIISWGAFGTSSFIYFAF